MPRVLVGDFGVIARLGLRDVLADLGLEVLIEEVGPEQFLTSVRQVQPDVVVVDLDRRGGAELASRVARDCAEVKVIACSTNEPRMRIYPRFHSGEFYESRLTRDQLAAAIRS